LEKIRDGNGAVVSTRGRVRSPAFSRSAHVCSFRVIAPKEATGSRFYIKGNGQEVQDLDPQIVNSVSSLNIISALLEGLVSEDPHDLHPVPGVAESWDISPDEKIYTFHLRHNAKWSNGDPVVAQNFAESYHRILSPALASPVAYMLYPVVNAEAFNKGKIDNFEKVGFRVLDDWRLQITLTNPTPYFLSLLNHYSWFPVPISTIQKYGPVLERSSRWTKPGRYVGNGPFTLEEWRLNDRVRVRKSATYWEAQNVRLNEIVFHTIDSNDIEERAFRSGQLHVTDSMPINRIDRYRREHPEFLRIDPYLGTYFYRVNVTRPPLNNRLVRRALAMAIDRQSIVDRVTHGAQLPASCFTPPNTAGYTCQSRFRTMSILHAKRSRRQVIQMAAACHRSRFCLTHPKTTSSSQRPSSKCGAKI
jgi:oligopeptide transport system substrate-binding protein